MEFKSALDSGEFDREIQEGIDMLNHEFGLQESHDDIVGLGDEAIKELDMVLTDERTQHDIMNEINDLGHEVERMF